MSDLSLLQETRGAHSTCCLQILRNGILTRRIKKNKISDTSVLSNVSLKIRVSLVTNSSNKIEVGEVVNRVFVIEREKNILLTILSSSLDQF